MSLDVHAIFAGDLIVLDERANILAAKFTAMVEAAPYDPKQKERFKAVAREAAPESLAGLEEAKDEQARFYALPAATMAAFTLGRFDYARSLAEETLELATQYSRDWNHGNAVNAAHPVLGLVALEERNVPAAVVALAPQPEQPSLILPGSH